MGGWRKGWLCGSYIYIYNIYISDRGCLWVQCVQPRILNRLRFAGCLVVISNGKNPSRHERAIRGSASTSAILTVTHSLLAARSPFEDDWEIEFLRFEEHFYWDCGAPRGRVSVCWSYRMRSAGCVDHSALILRKIESRWSFWDLKSARMCLIGMGLANVSG